jgi:hypothetical protein
MRTNASPCVKGNMNRFQDKTVLIAGAACGMGLHVPTWRAAQLSTRGLPLGAAGNWASIAGYEAG